MIRFDFCPKRSLHILRAAKRCVTVLLAVWLVSMLASDASACPTCKQALANGHEGVSLGYYWSILLMMAMPFVIFAGWGVFIWRAFKMQSQNRAAVECTTDW